MSCHANHRRTQCQLIIPRLKERKRDRNPCSDHITLQYNEFSGFLPFSFCPCSRHIMGHVKQLYENLPKSKNGPTIYFNKTEVNIHYESKRKQLHRKFLQKESLKF